MKKKRNMKHSDNGRLNPTRRGAAWEPGKHGLSQGPLLGRHRALLPHLSMDPPFSPANTQGFLDPGQHFTMPLLSVAQCHCSAIESFHQKRYLLEANSQTHLLPAVAKNSLA